MTIFTAASYALGVCCAAALTSCGGSQVPFAPAPTALQAARAQPPDRQADTMTRDLLYASDVNTNDLYAFRYPHGGLVFKLTGFDQPGGLCSDPQGNVFVTNALYENVVEYAHGARTPTQSLYLPGETLGCTVDPTTGDLAVIFDSYTQGTGVAVYAGAQGIPTITYSGFGAELQRGGYDNKGNLFLDAYTDNHDWGFFVLPRSGGPILYVTLSGGNFSKSGQIQWDGKHMAVVDESLDTVSRLKFDGPKGPSGHWSGTVLGVTTLKRCGNALQSWIQGSAIIVPCGARNLAQVKVWDYPSGGRPTRTVGKSVLIVPAAVTVSVAPRS